MTKDEALKLAIEYLEDNQHYVADNERHAYGMEYNNVIEKCKEALAQPEQELVAWGVFHFGGKRDRKLYSHCDTKEQAIAYIADRHQSDDTNTFRAAPLYTTPPQRKPLSDEQWQVIADTLDCLITRKQKDAIEAIIGIKE